MMRGGTMACKKGGAKKPAPKKSAGAKKPRRK